jgi:gliding motility-associated-like protein
VELITVSNNGCRDTVVRPVEIFPVPVASFTFDTVCFPSATQFTDLSTIAGGGVIDNWNWKFGDATMNPVDQHPAHNYAVWGDYQVTLTVTSADGCTHETVIGPARVHPKPAALFSSAIANCHQDTTHFEDLSTLANYPNDSIVNWAWQFGDGNGAVLPDPVHVYADEGFHDATLAVMSNHGCIDTVTHPVEIYPLPRVAFMADTTRGCQPFRVQFMDQTTIPAPYGLASWQWDFGDGTDSVYGYYPVNMYHTDSLGPHDVATFTVSLVVTSARGCVSSATRPNYITEYPKPNAWFDVDPKRAELLFARMQVTDLSSPNVIEWDYDLGDGSWYSVPNPFHVYQDTGTYTITQYVSTQYGCLDTAETKVIVDPEFYFYIPNTFTPNSDTHNQTFYGTGVGVASYQMIIFDRWGSHLFESGDMDLPWDGTKNGQQVQQGVYAYIFNIVDIKGDTHQYVGHVNLIR